MGVLKRKMVLEEWRGGGNFARQKDDITYIEKVGIFHYANEYSCL
jgi:hypothetical protein